MGRTRTFAIVALAALAVALVAVGTASAKKSSSGLQVEVFNSATKHPEALSTGATVEFTGTSEELQAPPFSCNIVETGLVGTLGTNNSKTDTVEVKDARNAHHESAATYSSCHEHGPLKSASLFWRGPTPLGTFDLSEKGKAEYKSASETKLVFVENSGPGFCEYGLKTLKGTFVTNLPEFLILEGLSGKAKLKASKVPGTVPCPKSIAISELELRARGGSLPEYPAGFENGEEGLGTIG